MQKFSELEYKRPDITSLRKQYAELTKKLSDAPDYATAKRVFLEMRNFETELEASITLAHIRSTMDTTDKFYDGEMQYFNKTLPTVLPAQKKAMVALCGSRFRPDFEAEYGTQLFRETELEMRISDRKNMLNMVREAMLCDSYKKAAAACKTDFRGEQCNFYGLLKHMESPDREERKEAFIAWAKLYEDAAPKLDGIYDKLIKVRRSMAKKLKLGSYIELAYLNKHRMDYTAADVARFREQVVKYIVPACAELRRQQTERIGVDKLKYYDETYMFSDGNPIPQGTKDELVEKARQMYHALSPESGEFFDFMVENQLFDLETRPGKHLGGYCTVLYKYRAPFIFSNFNGTSADVDVLTHEAGHAFESFLASRCQPISDYCYSTSEINEIHSMSMEHFTYPWMESFFGEDADKYRYGHLCSSLMVLPYIVCVDEFQHRVFEQPDMTAQRRREVWKELEGKYLPWRDYDGVEFLENGGFWMQKQHIFLYPFYYIDYALAQMGAFEFYKKSLENREQAWADYIKLCRAGGSKGYFELLELAGLSNPLTDDSAVQRIVATVMEQIGKAAR